MPIDWSQLNTWVAGLIEGLAVLIILAAIFLALQNWIGKLRRGVPESFANRLILALDFMVAADIVRTVLEPNNWQDIMVLGAIIALRIVLSFALLFEELLERKLGP